MTFRRALPRLRRDENGVAAIEFALIGPVFFVLFLGVLQVGLALQSYNAMRNVSADVARYAMIQYQTGNTLSNSQIRSWARNHAQEAPYLMDPDHLGVTIEDAANQRVTGAKELTITVTYVPNSVLEFIGINAPRLTYDRPAFLMSVAPPAPTPTAPAL